MIQGLCWFDTIGLWGSAHPATMELRRRGANGWRSSTTTTVGRPTSSRASFGQQRKALESGGTPDRGPSMATLGCPRGPTPPPYQVLATLRRYNSIPGGGSNVALHCDAFRQPFSVSLRRAEDWEMWIRLAKRGLSRVGSRTSDGLSLHSTNLSLAGEGG